MKDLFLIAHLPSLRKLSFVYLFLSFFPLEILFPTLYQSEIVCRLSCLMRTNRLLWLLIVS